MNVNPFSSLPLLALFACGPAKDAADCYDGFERDADGNCVAVSAGQSGNEQVQQDPNADGGGTAAGDPMDSGSPHEGGDNAEGNLDGIDGGDETAGTDGMAGGMDDGVTDGGDADVDGGSGDGTTGGEDGFGELDPCEGRIPGTTVGSCATDFTLVNHMGLEVRLKDFAGDVIVLDLSSFT